MNNRDREILTRLLDKYDQLDERERALQRDFAQIKETINWIKNEILEQRTQSIHDRRWTLALISLFISLLFSILNFIGRWLL